MAGRMVSLARRPEDRMGSETALLQGEEYPPGMCLTLTDSELEKLDLSDEGVEPGDMLHLTVMTTVKAVHKDDAGCSIHLQIIGGGIENESTESEEAEDEADEED